MSDESPFGDDLELRLVRRPAGSRRSKSTGTPGAERDLLRDSDGALLGPTESFPVDPDELREALALSEPTHPPDYGQGRSPGKQMAIDIASDVAYVVVREAVAQIYDLVIAPKARAKWTQFKQNRGRVQQVSGDALAANVVVADLSQVDESSTDLVAQPPTAIMDSAQFRQRFALMLAAENFVADERRLLSTAQISDEADLPPQLVHAMKLVLEEGSASLDEAALRLLIEFLRSSNADLVELVESDDGAMPELETPDHED